LTSVSGRIVGADKLLENLETDLADYEYFKKKDNSEEDEAELIKADFNFDTEFTVQYIIRGTKDLKDLTFKISDKNNELIKLLSKDKAITSADVVNAIVETIRKKENSKAI
jgi:hypothetical protein